MLARIVQQDRHRGLGHPQHVLLETHPSGNSTCAMLNRSRRVSSTSRSP
ncbi:MAG: hypothetical protein ACRDT0_01725 [Pseudonocardiaceae bacterium]